MSLKKTFKSISYIGGGRVTYLLLKGLKRSLNYENEIIVCDPDPKSLSKIEKIQIGNLITSTDNIQALEAQLIFLAVHPPVIDEVLSQMSGKVDKRSIVVSLIPTKSIEYISGKLSGFNRIVRMIPNAPSVINLGYNPITFSETITDPEKENLSSLFSAWGEAPEVEEKDLEGYAIISGMGPTYFWFQWELMVQLASQFGFDENISRQAIKSMIKGSNELLFNSDFHPSEVLDLIPVYPLKESEEQISGIIAEKLNGLFNKLNKATI
jgi:pyrroline-5-carboxylate reductase